MLYVGDDPHADVLGARAAGLRTAWVNRRGLPWPDVGPAAELEVASLEQLEAALESGALSRRS
jgi:putative hydrolase of the HAD superfamily